VLTREPGCEFCNIVAGEEPAEIIFESTTALAFFPLNPATVGHTLLIPKTHVTDLWQLRDARLASELALVTVRLGRALRKVVEPDGMNAITSAGEAASQTVFHLHIHVVPRWSDDAFGSIWPRSGPLPAKVVTDVAKRVRQELASGES
jgi:histidine triad (HIT) family protein